MKRMLIAAAAALALATSAAQTVDEATRGKNLDRALSIAREAGEPAEARASLDEWLGSLPKEQALQAELDLVQLAVETGTLKSASSRFAREQLNIVERYMPLTDPTRDPLHDYWSYRVMIEARHERGEIPVEEREYLIGRKHAELRRTLEATETAREQRAQAARQAAQRRSAAEDAEARALELERTRIMIQSFQRGLRDILPGPAVTCTRVGLQTICR